MRVGIVGNSHIGALKFGLEALQDDCNHEVSLWAMPGGPFEDKVKIDGLSLSGLPKVYSSSTADGGTGEDVFVGSDYDVVVLYAQSLRLEGIGQGLKEVEKCTSGFRDAYLREISVERFAFQYAKNLTAASVRTIIHAAPLFGEGFVSRKTFKGEATEFLRNAAASLSADFMMQPEDTISVDGKTKAEFLTGSKHLDERSRENDFKHMNAEFGRRIMKEILRKL